MKAITSRILFPLSIILGLALSTSAFATPITDIAIIMDTSGSMGSTGWDNEEDFVSNFILDGIPYEHSRLGIIQFSSSSKTKQIYGFEDQQDDRELIANVVQDMNYRGGSTYMKKAIDTAINLFDNESTEENNKAIIMLTDGNPYPTRQSPCDRAPLLDARGIDVFIVGMGNGWTRSKIDCLVEDSYLDIIATDSTSAYDLSTAMIPLTERIGAISGVQYTDEMTCNEAGAIWDSNRCRAAWPSDAEPEPINEPTTFFSMVFGLFAMLFMRRYRHKLQFKRARL